MRFRYPFDLEWLESGALYQAYRTMHGQSTYAPPENGYLPLFHPPGYPSALAVVGKIFGLSYGVARGFSFACFVLAMALIALEIARSEESRLDRASAVLLAIGGAAAGVPVFLAFHDMVREDSMALALAVLGAALAQERKMRSRRIVLLAIILTAALYTRLVTVFFSAWIVLFVLVRHRKSGIALILTTATACGLQLVLLQLTSKGYYWIYTISIYQGHSLTAGRFANGVKVVFKYAPFVAALLPLAVGLAVKRRLSSRALLWLGMYLCAIPASLLPWSKVGGFENDLIPICFFAAPAAVFLFLDLKRALASYPRVRYAVASSFWIAGAAWLFVRTYDQKMFIPSDQRWEQAEAMLKFVGKLRGGAIAPNHPFMPIEAGQKSEQICDMPYLDMTWANQKTLKLGGFLDKVHARYALIAGIEAPHIAAEIAQRYEYDRPFKNTPSMVIGERSHLRHIFHWRTNEPADAKVLFDFEEPKFAGWHVEGDAFGDGPTAGAVKGQGSIVGMNGKQLANSFSPTLKDAAKGRLVSPSFVIDRPHLSLRMSGKPNSSATRVELRVNGKAERTAIGIFDNQTLVTHVWDVHEFDGKYAQIAIIDDDSQGHVTCDRIVAY